jgi:uncharacterized SAM-binding protein YcdF (DUF218 family)
MIRWLITVIFLAIIFIIATTVYLQPNDMIQCGDTPSSQAKCQKVDAIVAISGGDTNARTDHAINLFKNGWADKIVFSGAAKDKEGLSNAAAMKLRAMRAGINESAILIDEYAENTTENARNSHQIFTQHRINRVILVTSGYHQRRASLEFQRAVDNVHILNSPVIKDSGWSIFWWMTPWGWWLAMGELVKIIAFYAGGLGR